MELFERLLYLHQDPAKIAGGFAEYMRFGPDADRSQIPSALTSILKARNECKNDLEDLERERPTPWDDFGGTPTQAELDAWNARTYKERQEEQKRVKDMIRSLDLLFWHICHALAVEALTLTGGEISAIKRAGLPKNLERPLEMIRREHLARIPKEERLDDENAAILYKELTRQGLISGAYGAFEYHLGQVTKEMRKAPGDGLKWLGNTAEFAYFVRCFCNYTQSKTEIRGRTNRIKALCLAFGFDETQRANTIKPYLSDQHTPTTSASIDAIFNVLKPQQ